MQISLGCPNFSILGMQLVLPLTLVSPRGSHHLRLWWGRCLEPRSSQGVGGSATHLSFLGSLELGDDGCFLGRLERSDGGFVCLFFVVATQLFFGIFTPKIGENGSNLRNIFSDGLVQPPTSLFFVCFCCCWKSWATCLACFIGSISLFPSQWK